MTYLIQLKGKNKRTPVFVDMDRIESIDAEFQGQGTGDLHQGSVITLYSGKSISVHETPEQVAQFLQTEKAVREDQRTARSGNRIGPLPQN